MTPAGLDAALDTAAELLASAERIGTLGHVSPDGDALGASLGLALSARAAGKSAVASFGEPFVVPTMFRFLNQEALVPAGEFPSGLDVVVACDTAVPARLGSLAEAAASARRVIVVDHHPSGSDFGDVRVVDPTAAATTDLVYRLLRRLEWPITPDIASCLYTGLVTDTGRFQYESTSPAVHELAAELLRSGADPVAVNRHVYEEAPFGYLAVAGAVLARARLEANLPVVWSVLHADDLAAAGIGLEDTDGLIDLVRVAAESEVACLLKAIVPGETRASLRSRGTYDVGRVAESLGGGGHHNAAGCTVPGPPDQAIAAILAEVARQAPPS